MSRTLVVTLTPSDPKTRLLCDLAQLRGGIGPGERAALRALPLRTLRALLASEAASAPVRVRPVVPPHLVPLRLSLVERLRLAGTLGKGTTS